MSNTIQKAVQAQNAPAAMTEQKASGSLNAVLNSYLDKEGLRKRFDELLGARAPQFISSLVAVVNGDPYLQRAFSEAPLTVIQSALKAASYDLPIDPTLGFAYIVAFNVNRKDANGNWKKRYEATFIPGYKGLTQLCLRTGAYAKIPNAVDVREGELVSYDRLTGDCEIRWEQDFEKRSQLPIIGYAGYFRLKNGAEMTIYMTKKEIEEHERKNRKGSEMGKGWRESFDEMARKTVIRRLISRFGLMSIQYRSGDDDMVRMAADLLPENNEPTPELPEGSDGGDFVEVNDETGEVVEPTTEDGNDG